MVLLNGLGVIFILGYRVVYFFLLKFSRFSFFGIIIVDGNKNLFVDICVEEDVVFLVKDRVVVKD